MEIECDIFSLQTIGIFHSWNAQQIEKYMHYHYYVDCRWTTYLHGSNRSSNTFAARTTTRVICQHEMEGLYYDGTANCYLGAILKWRQISRGRGVSKNLTLLNKISKFYTIKVWQGEEGGPKSSKKTWRHLRMAPK